MKFLVLVLMALTTGICGFSQARANDEPDVRFTMCSNTRIEKPGEPRIFVDFYDYDDVGPYFTDPIYSQSRIRMDGIETRYTFIKSGSIFRAHSNTFKNDQGEFTITQTGKKFITDNGEKLKMMEVSIKENGKLITEKPLMVHCRRYGKSYGDWR